MCIIMCLHHTILDPFASLSIKLIYQSFYTYTSNSSRTAKWIFLKFDSVSFTKKLAIWFSFRSDSLTDLFTRKINLRFCANELSHSCSAHEQSFNISGGSVQSFYHVLDLTGQLWGETVCTLSICIFHVWYSWVFVCFRVSCQEPYSLT